MRKLLTVLTALCLLLIAGAFAEGGTYLLTNEAGGVIDRGEALSRMRGLICELDIAYLETSSPYLSKGVQSSFTIHATGGDGIYSYSFNIYRRDGNSGLFYYKAAQTVSRSDTFYYTPSDKDGQYVLLVRVIDSAGSYIEWQSQVFESATSASAAKARALAEECRMSADGDYARALWLHDWLIYNAEYDHDYKYFYPDGVLLYGKGVCQSYALAYDMMLKLIGIDCIYVTGSAGGDAHGWNLVYIDGGWYHVDCTWDDPGNGMENHDYFCVPDEIMLRDHQWRYETPILPQCTEKDYMYAVRSGADTCATQEDVIAILNESLENRKHYTEIWYTGTMASFDFDSAVARWYESARLTGGFMGYKYTAGLISLKMEFDFGDGYPGPGVPSSITIDEDRAEFRPGDTKKLLVLSMPSSADKTGIVFSSSDESVIRVENGLITCVAPGFSVITAKHPSGVQSQVTLYVSSGGVFVLPASIKEIEEEAFADNSLLETVVLQSGVLSVGERAFADCALLKSVSVPASVSFIAPDAFLGSDRVTILCEEGSYAHEYALLNAIDFECMSKEP